MLLKHILSHGVMAATAFAIPTASSTSLQHVEATKRSPFDTIQVVVQDVVKSTNALTEAVNDFSGKVEDALPLLEASAALQTTIEEGNAKVQKSPSLLLTQVLIILPDVLDLNSAVGAVSSALVRKKGIFDEAMLTPVVLEQLQGQQGAAQTFVNTLITKLPLYMPVGLGELLSAPALLSLQYAIFVFSQ